MVMALSWRSGRVLLVLALAVPAGGCRDDAPEADPAPPAPPGEEFPDPGAAVVALTAAAAADWRLFEVAGLPPLFQPAGWGPGDSIWGLSRNVPALAPVGGGEARRLASQAWGVIPAPDGRRVAWINERGLWVGNGGGDAPALHALDAHPASEGGPPTELLWAPEGDRILAGWMLEWDAVHTVVAVPGGAARHIRTTLDGYFLREPRLWLDDERILFVTRASRSLSGEQEYGSGYRADLAVLRLTDEAYGTVTAAPDGVFLEPAGRVAAGRVLVTELDGAGRAVRHWSYDTRSWERTPFPAPPGRLRSHPSHAQVLVLRDLEVDRIEEGGGRYGATLVDAAGVTTPFAGVRGDVVRAFWSPDGRRLLISADHRGFVVERR
jgi:hypothetical protein